MGKIILVTGGSRSGKSRYAQKRAESFLGLKLFIATCPRLDSEIDRRIEKHVQERVSKGWETIEEEHDLAESIAESRTHTVILVDCLTLWVNNLLYSSTQRILPGDKHIEENDIQKLCEEILKICRKHKATVIFVTNEIGSGIVPDSAEVRLYRDLVGRCNQSIAAGADEVILVSCGIPLVLKKISVNDECIDELT